MSALSELAYTEAKLRARRRRGDAGGLLHLRTAVVELLQAVLHAHKAAVEASWREAEGEGEGAGWATLHTLQVLSMEPEMQSSAEKSNWSGRCREMQGDVGRCREM